MKRIQKGFTLIELMIVVAIIGILAAVAIPAYQDYVVKSKLSKVMSTLDPLKLALMMYYQNQGGFPVSAGDTVTAGLAGTLDKAAAATPPDTWGSLGLTNYPALPGEVQQLAYVTPTSTTQTTDNFALLLQLQNIRAGTIDGTVVGVFPTPGNTVTSATAAGFAANATVTGSTAVNWYYACNKGTAQGTNAPDIIEKQFFKNPDNSLCQ